jgi:hypothetical protein
MKYYIQKVFRGVEPESLIGPYGSWESLIKRAKKVRKGQREEDGIFWLLITGDRDKPTVGSFSNHELGLTD